MTAEQAIQYIQELYSHTNLADVMTVVEVEPPDLEVDRTPIAIEITGEKQGETASVIILIHPDRPFDADGKLHLTKIATVVCKLIVEDLIAGRRATIANAANAAKYN